MNRHAVYQLKNFFRAYFNTLATVCAFLHINRDVSHRSGLLFEFRRITGSEINYTAALPNPFIFLKHTLIFLTRIKFVPSRYIDRSPGYFSILILPNHAASGDGYPQVFAL
jgi:hypothetical protein